MNEVLLDLKFVTTSAKPQLVRTSMCFEENEINSFFVKLRVLQSSA